MPTQETARPSLVGRIAAVLPDRVFVEAIALVHPRVEPEIRRVVGACPPDCVAVDVGAWYGPWTRSMSRRAREVVAFEANPNVAAVLRKTAPANAVVHQVAISDQDGATVELGVSGGRGREGRSSVEPQLHVGAERIAVPTRRLDSYGLEDVRLIKVDVEGHELAVLQGARGVLERAHPVLVVELDVRHGNIAPVMQFMADLGYRASVLSHRGWVEARTEELEDRQQAALSAGRRDGYLASAVRGWDGYVNNVVFVHADSGWQPS